MLIIKRASVKSSNGCFWYYLPFIAVLVSGFFFFIWHVSSTLAI